MCIRDRPLEPCHSHYERPTSPLPRETVRNCAAECLFVCLSVRISRRYFTKFSVILPARPRLGPPLSALRHVTHFRFSDDVTFSRKCRCTMCIPKRREHNSTASIPTKFCSSIKIRQVHIMGCTPGGRAKLAICDILMVHSSMAELHRATCTTFTANSYH